MNFDFSEDQKLLQKTARDFLAEHGSLAVARAVLESQKPYDADLWKNAAQLGWLGTVIPEAHGGAGFGHLELAVIAEELGRAVAPIPFASSVYLATEAILQAGSEAQKSEYLSKLASGEWIGSVALEEKPGLSAPGEIETRIENGKITGAKQPVLDGDVANFAVVAARGQGGVSLALVDLDGAGVERRRLRSIDPSRSVASLHFDGAAAQLLGAEGQGTELAERILDRAAVLLSFEQLGGASRAFEMTREFTLGRYAFGRPVASFQAVKHRLADLWCEIELARSNCYYGAWALSNDAPELELGACMARVAASKAFDLAAVEMLQLHGGVGFTWEYDCHLFYRRAKLLSVALGSPATWREKLIRRLEAKRSS